MMKAGYYWYKNDFGIYNPVCIIEDYLNKKMYMYEIGYNKGKLLANLDENRFGPEIILPKELQDDNNKT